MYKIVFNKKFIKNFNKRINKNLKSKVDNIIFELEKGLPYPKNLKSHQLNGNLFPLYSLSLTDDIRIIFDIDKQNKIVYLIDIGTHNQVY